MNKIDYALFKMIVLNEDNKEALLAFFDDFIYWDTINSYNNAEKIEKNFLSTIKINQYEKYYFSMLLYFLEKEKNDIHKIDFKLLFKNEFLTNPIRFLINADDLSHYVVKQAAFFLEEISDKKVLAQNILLKSPVFELTDKFFISTEYEEKLAKTQENFVIMFEEIKQTRINLNINNNFSINVEILLSSALVRQTQAKYQPFLYELISQNIIDANSPVNFNADDQNILEYYLFQPTSTRLECVLLMLEKTYQLNNIDINKLYELLINYNIDYLDNFIAEKNNFFQILDRVKKMKLSRDLQKKLSSSSNIKEELHKI